jgi:hypothetical protein
MSLRWKKKNGPCRVMMASAPAAFAAAMAPSSSSGFAIVYVCIAMPSRFAAPSATGSRSWFSG